MVHGKSLSFSSIKLDISLLANEMVEDAGRRGNMLIVFKLDFEKMYYWIN